MRKGILTAVIAGALIGGCNLFKKKAPEEEIIIKDTVPPQTKRKLEEALVEIPQPSDIFQLAQADALTFIEGATLPTSAHTRASTIDEKNLVAGAYGANLTYSAVMGKRELTEKYITSLYEIAQELGLGTVFDEEFVEEARNNIDSPQALNEIVTRAFVKVDKYLRSNERVRQAALLLAGSWVEGMWLALNSLKDKPLNETTSAMFRKLGEQTYSLSKIISLLQEYGSDPSVKNIISALQPVHDWYSQNITTSQDFKPEHIQQLLPLVRNARQSLFGFAI